MGGEKPLGELVGALRSQFAIERTEEEWEAHDARVRAELAEEERVRRRRRWTVMKGRLLMAGCTERALEVVFRRNPRQTDAVKVVPDIGAEGITVIAGNNGCGKTVAAHVWLLGLDGWETWPVGRVRIMTAAYFARVTRYSRDGEPSKFDQANAAEKLVFDDMSVEFVDEKGSALTDFDEVFDERWRNKRPTLITTNLKREDFRDRYGERIYDRIREGGRWFNVKQESLRGAT